jgi:hypothetical protein
MVELVWDGKYDATSRRVAPPRIALPVETVIESAQQSPCAPMDLGTLTVANGHSSVRRLQDPTH